MFSIKTVLQGCSIIEKTWELSFEKKDTAPLQVTIPLYRVLRVRSTPALDVEAFLILMKQQPDKLVRESTFEDCRKSGIQRHDSTP